MLQPRKTKHRKAHKGRIRGAATRGTDIDFGQFGLQTLENGRLTSRQIESARIAITRYVKRGAKLWIRIFPDKPLTRKPAETRMGKGKGDLSEYVAPVKRGQILYELSGVTTDLAKEAFRLASHKLPVKTRTIERSEEIV